MTRKQGYIFLKNSDVYFYVICSLVCMSKNKDVYKDVDAISCIAALSCENA